MTKKRWKWLNFPTINRLIFIYFIFLFFASRQNENLRQIMYFCNRKRKLRFPHPEFLQNVLNTYNMCVLSLNSGSYLFYLLNICGGLLDAWQDCISWSFSGWVELKVILGSDMGSIWDIIFSSLCKSHLNSFSQLSNGFSTSLSLWVSQSSIIWSTPI